MSSLILWVDSAGSVYTTMPAYPSAKGLGLSDADLLTLVLQREIPRVAESHGVSVVTTKVVDETAFTVDPYFTRAWVWNDGIEVDMPKAREIHMDRIRTARDAELQKLDVPFMRTVEAGDVAEQQRIAGLKQTLRDIPQTFDLSVYATPEELKSAWPPGLHRMGE